MKTLAGIDILMGQTKSSVKLMDKMAEQILQKIIANKQQWQKRLFFQQMAPLWAKYSSSLLHKVCKRCCIVSMQIVKITSIIWGHNVDTGFKSFEYETRTSQEQTLSRHVYLKSALRFIRPNKLAWSTISYYEYEYRNNIGGENRAYMAETFKTHENKLTRKSMQRNIKCRYQEISIAYPLPSKGSFWRMLPYNWTWLRRSLVLTNSKCRNPCNGTNP